VSYIEPPCRPKPGKGLVNRIANWQAVFAETVAWTRQPCRLDGQGAWYWKQGTSISRPVFFRLHGVTGSTLSGFTLKNSPFRTFSILNSEKTTISGLTLDSSAGNDLAKNTDGFDLSKNDGVTITGNKI